MNRLELDKWDLKRLFELHKKGRINLQPEYQRGKVWNDAQRYDLIDTVLRNWPMGLILLRVEETQDADKVPIDRYDVVDGQQRLTTLFAYMDGSEPWALKAPPKLKEFRPYKQITQGKQTRVDEYKVALALMREYEPPEIQDVYSRLQTGKPLKIGERIKALRTPFKEYVRELAAHKLFDLARNRFRDSNWNLAAQFLKATYKGDPLERVEFDLLQAFLQEEKMDDSKAQKAKERASKIMNYELKTLREAIEQTPTFEDIVGSARTLKWLFALLMPLLDTYALGGKEHLVANGLQEYYHARGKVSSPEWVAYHATGRTGRMDTDDVTVCLNQLAAYIINASGADPLDTNRNRFFTASQRKQIWENSKGVCQGCQIPLSKTNFHADHIKPHREGGQTTIDNGQALCSACNRKKGADILFPI
ncbi:MAG: DUF262 domain-containing protein [Chloroflexi bacterium]|nr:DUF262 domain-containing protein [Chloroflexota bacterium]